MVDALYSPRQEDKVEYGSEQKSLRQGRGLRDCEDRETGKRQGLYTLDHACSATLGIAVLTLQRGSQRAIHLGLLGGCSSELRENGTMA